MCVCFGILWFLFWGICRLILNLDCSWKFCYVCFDLIFVGLVVVAYVIVILSVFNIRLVCLCYYFNIDLISLCLCGCLDFLVDLWFAFVCYTCEIAVFVWVLGWVDCWVLVVIFVCNLICGFGLLYWGCVLLLDLFVYVCLLGLW